MVSTASSPIPISLYIHLPWCVQKCPYCDFNSHPLAHRRAGDLERYIDRLIEDYDRQDAYRQGRPLHSIFIGGGTPSLVPPEHYQRLFKHIFSYVPPANDLEITLEANPGTLDNGHLEGYRSIGINRLSIGAQSFNSQHLAQLGRIHDANAIHAAVHTAKAVGFEQINLDIMFGLPKQDVADALSDLTTAIALAPTHLSWYELTIEPNTYFHRYPPPRPSDHIMASLETKGRALLAKQGYPSYEVSAYAQPDAQCRHNLNYWQFGDYIGIGAGAHGKYTIFDGTGTETAGTEATGTGAGGAEAGTKVEAETKTGTRRHYRTQNLKHPSAYMTQPITHITTVTPIDANALAFEFMLNALRLDQPIDEALFYERTGLTFKTITPALHTATTQGLLTQKNQQLLKTSQGQRYLNDLIALFF